MNYMSQDLHNSTLNEREWALHDHNTHFESWKGCRQLLRISSANQHNYWKSPQIREIFWKCLEKNTSHTWSHTNCMLINHARTEIIACHTAGHCGNCLKCVWSHKGKYDKYTHKSQLVQSPIQSDWNNIWNKYKKYVIKVHLPALFELALSMLCLCISIALKERRFT